MVGEACPERRNPSCELELVSRPLELLSGALESLNSALELVNSAWELADFAPEHLSSEPEDACSGPGHRGPEMVMSLPRTRWARMRSSRTFPMLETRDSR